MRTLIIACSATKRPDAGLLPALDRYDGPAYRTLRSNLAAAGELRVVILSAEFGLLEADAAIPDYDRLMTTKRAGELAGRVGRELERMNELGELGGEIFFFGGATYRAAVQVGLSLPRRSALLQRLRFSSGGIGQQLGQLKAFLRAGEAQRLAELKADANAYNPPAERD